MNAAANTHRRACHVRLPEARMDAWVLCLQILLGVQHVAVSVASATLVYFGFRQETIMKAVAKEAFPSIAREGLIWGSICADALIALALWLNGRSIGQSIENAARIMAGASGGGNKAGPMASEAAPAVKASDHPSFIEITLAPLCNVEVPAVGKNGASGSSHKCVHVRRLIVKKTMVMPRIIVSHPELPRLSATRPPLRHKMI